MRRNGSRDGKSVESLEEACDAIVEQWARSLELRDYEPRGHIRRVTELTVAFACALGVAQDKVRHLRRGAQLHDIGKIAIPDQILMKSEALTEAEWQVVHRHPLTAYELLDPIVLLHPARVIPYGHHEKWDGSGYPQGLAGDKIPQAARMFALIDTWDTMRSDRPYRRAWSDAKVLAYILDRAGYQFDPHLARTFAKLVADGKMGNGTDPVQKPERARVRKRVRRLKQA